MATSVVSEKATTRLYFADHLRAALVILVVLHHLAVIYAANTAFYYVEPAYNQPGVALLVLFQLLNQAFFMGALFLLSGHFTPGSFDHKGTRSFLKDRLLRLGIALIAFMFVLGPLASIGTYQMPASLTHITTPLTWQDYPSMIGPGPLWFVEMLIIFDLGYVAWRLLAKNRAARPAGNFSPPGYRVIAAFILALAVSSYLVRIVVPLGTYGLHFPSLAYLPQYLSFFVIGTIAYRQDWLRTIPDSMGKAGFRMALAATIVLFPVVLSGKAAFLGGGYWQSAVYALWDSIFSVGMCLGLITLFRRRYNHTGKLGRFLSRQSFTVYVIHAPVIVFVALALRWLQAWPLFKFGLAAIIGVPLCFALAYLVRRVPLVFRPRYAEPAPEAVEIAKQVCPPVVSNQAWDHQNMDGKMGNALEIRDLRKDYKDFSLNSISFTLPTGHIMGFVGQNGAGKTTTIRLILNMADRAGGEIAALGMDNIQDEQRIKQDVGVVFDSTYFVESWTVSEVEKALKGFYDHWSSPIYRQYAQRFHLPLDKKVKDLSRGMRMKLMLAVAVSHQAKLLILDEPTSGLDPVARDELLEILSNYISDGQRSVLFSTHITSDLEKIADYITLIEHGNIFYSGTKDGLIESFLIVKGGPGDLGDGLKKKIIGLTQNGKGFSGLIRASEEGLLSQGIITEQPSIDEILVAISKEEGKYE